MLLKVVPLVYRKRRATSSRRASAVVVAAPVLVAASYDADGPRVTLTFDRAVDVSAFDGAQLTVNDPLSLSSLFDGAGGATLVSPTVIDVALVPIDLPSGTSVVLDATGETGIVSHGAGGPAWAGVDDVELPFP